MSYWKALWEAMKNPPLQPRPNRAVRRASKHKKVAARPVLLDPKLITPQSDSLTANLKNPIGTGNPDGSGEIDFMELPPVESKGHLPLPDFGSEKPKRGRPKGSTAKNAGLFTAEAPTSSGARAGKDQQIKTGLIRYYSLFALPLSRIDSTGYDTTVVLVMAEKCADAWLEVAHQNKQVYQALDLLTSQNAYIDIIFAHLAIGAGIAANHGVIPVSWVIPFELPVPQPQAAQAAQAPMGMPEQTLGYASPLDVPVMAPNPPRMDASATGEGLGQVAGMQPVQFDEGIMETIKRQALEQALAEQAIAAAQAQAAVSGIPGYNPVDTAPRATHNPAVLSRLVGRRAQ